MISTDTAHVAPTLHNPQSFVDDDARVDSIAEEWIGYWGATIPIVPLIGNGTF